MCIYHNFTYCFILNNHKGVMKLTNLIILNYIKFEGGRILNEIKKISREFDIKCMKMSDFKFTLYIFGLMMLLFLITLPIEIISRGIENLPRESQFDNLGILSIFIPTVILTPYIETILFYIIPLGVYCKLKDKFKLNKRWDFIVGGLCGLNFGILHAISYPDILTKGFNFTIIGTLYAYVFFRYKRLGKKSVFSIWIIHALTNLIAVGPRLIGLMLN